MTTSDAKSRIDRRPCIALALLASSLVACSASQPPTGEPAASASASDGAPPATSAAAAEATSGATLYEQIQKEVGGGGEILVIADTASESGGIEAVSSTDWTRRKRLDVGPVSWMLVDPFTRVIWFGQRGEKTRDIRMLDLEGKTVKSELLVSVEDECNCLGWTDVKYAQGFVYPQPTGAVTEGDGYGMLLRLDEAAPRLEFVWVPPGGINGETSPGEAREPMPKAALSKEISARLAEIAKRAAGKKPMPTPVSRPKVTKSLGGCEPKANLKPKKGETSMEDIWCGDAEALEGTSFVRVVSGWMVGAGTYARWRIYDATGTLPASELPDFMSAVVSPSGKWAFIDGGLVDLTTLQLKLPDITGAFLDGGVTFPERTHGTPEFR